MPVDESMNTVRDKLDSLRRRFRDLESAVIAFSGGVDSAVLAKVGHEELGDRMAAVTARSPSIPRADMGAAEDFCKRFGIPHHVIETKEFDDEAFRSNPADRCYHCKKELYRALLDFASSRGIRSVLEGTNASDLEGHRPGNRASREQDRVATPLIECGISKDEVRAIAKELNLGEVAAKPATACLSSRIPTGMRLDPDILAKIDRAEDLLRSLGMRQVRVRHHGDLARIEIEPQDLEALLEHRATIDDSLRAIGYRYVTLDLRGYRPSIP
jgi:uncharacterized protein